MNQPGAVLFDAVGTLFAVRGTVGEIYARTARSCGVQVDAGLLDRRFAAGFARRAAPATDSRRWWQELVAECFADAAPQPFEPFFDRLWNAFASADAWQLYPETLAVVAALHGRGLPLAVVSNFDERLHGVLAALGLRPYFSAVLISSEVGYAKPDPRLFAAALDCLGVTAAAALHVGDSNEDVLGARAAGIAVLRVMRDRPPAASGVISSLADLICAGGVLAGNRSASDF